MFVKITDPCQSWSDLDTALHDLSVITDPPRVSPCAARMSSVSSVSDQTRSRTRISLTQISDPEVGLSPHRTEPPSPPLLSSVRWAHISGVTTLAPRLSCHCDTWGGGGGVLKNGQTNSWKHVLLSSLSVCIQCLVSSKLTLTLPIHTHSDGDFGHILWWY